MNYQGAIIRDMESLLALFATHCSERETLDWLQRAVTGKGNWRNAHGVFNHIRNKLAKAVRIGDANRAAQYNFEAICAKTLYNLSCEPAPFDPDSPYWIIPCAIALARQLGIADSEVLNCISFPV